jgi:hypothetical protein
MKLLKGSSVLTLFVWVSVPHVTQATDAKAAPSSGTNTVFTGLSKTKSETPTPPKDTKPAEIKKTRVVNDRKAGTITLKPLTVNFSGLTFGMSRKSQLINTFPKDPYRHSFATLSNQAQAIGSSYDLEIGVMITRNVEAFAIAGIDRQQGFINVIVSANTLNQYDNLAYNFKNRTNYLISLGGRYYWNTQKPWFPFIGLMGTAIRQGDIKAIACDVGPNGFVPTFPAIGPITLQRAKTLLGGTFQVGADYQYTDFVSITFVAGLQYTPRVGASFSSIFSPQQRRVENITCRDNRKLWSVPIMAALKFTL